MCKIQINGHKNLSKASSQSKIWIGLLGLDQARAVQRSFGYDEGSLSLMRILSPFW